MYLKKEKLVLYCNSSSWGYSISHVSFGWYFSSWFLLLIQCRKSGLTTYCWWQTHIIHIIPSSSPRFDPEPKPFAGFKSPFWIYELYRMWNFPSSHHLGVSRNWATQKRSRFQDKPHGLGWFWGSVLGNPSRKAPLRLYLLPSGYLT